MTALAYPQTSAVLWRDQERAVFKVSRPTRLLFDFPGQASERERPVELGRLAQEVSDHCDPTLAAPR